MKKRTLRCFEQFRCIGGDCKDSCCIGWEIDVDEDSFQRFQRMEGAFAQRIRDEIVTEADGCHHYKLKEHDRCPFLNEKGLCEQILHCGEDILCEICTQHPRFFRMAGDTQEWGVGLACPEGARLLLSEPSVRWTDTVTELDDSFLDYLLDVRDTLAEQVQDSSRSLPQRLGRLLDIAETVQEQIDWGDCDAEAITPEEQLHEVYAGESVHWLDALRALEPIDGEWTDTLSQGIHAAGQPELMREFSEKFFARSWETENVLIYLLFRYVLKAYDDRDLLYWVKVCVWFVLTAEGLSVGRWLNNGKAFSIGDHEDILRILSKEIEYDPDIIEGLDGLMTALD